MIVQHPLNPFRRPRILAMTGPGSGSPFSPDPGVFSGELKHDPVMVEEILRDMQLQPGGIVVDGTLGLAGHSLRFIESVRPGGTLVGLDWDESMLERARARIGAPGGVNVVLIHDDFRQLSTHLDQLGMRANGILLDLGLNSAQIDDPGRGFSFKESGPLDMRMDRTKGESASSVLNRMTPNQIEAMLLDLGDERWAKKIAHVIVERRREKPLKTTQDLVDCVLAAIPPKFREQRIHPATRTFQAVRIYVNGELEGLEQALTEASWALAQGGVLCVLSYHSGEDRIVKNVFKQLAREGFAELHKKPLLPTEEEIRRNARSRSAKLRSIQRLPIARNAQP
jgi:16S rRNA (cytosine1402-N4)-methyltransferase